MNTKGIDVKERLQAIIDECDPMSDYLIGTNLQALLADLDAAELRKCPKCGNEDEPLQACDHCGHTWYTTSKLDRGIERAEPPKPTGNPIAFKRPCSTCGHQGNIMDKYCGSCGIEHLNWIPKSAECKNRVQVCPECNIDMYQDISTKNAGLWVWYCPECGQEIKIT